MKKKKDREDSEIHLLVEEGLINFSSFDFLLFLSFVACFLALNKREREKDGRRPLETPTACGLLLSPVAARIISTAIITAVAGKLRRGRGRGGGSLA